MIIREIEKQDVHDLFVVRTKTRENNMTLDELEKLGITEKSVTEMLNNTHRGWLCKVDGKVVGFSMGNKTNGEMWVIAILPEYEEKGIGAKIITEVENWLFSEGWNEIWLTTDVDESLRAYGFYKKQGWVDNKIEDGLRYMKKTKSSTS